MILSVMCLHILEEWTFGLGGGLCSPLVRSPKPNTTFCFSEPAANRQRNSWVLSWSAFVSWHWLGKNVSCSAPTWSLMALRRWPPPMGWCWWLLLGPSTETQAVWASMSKYLASSVPHWRTTAGRSSLSTWRSEGRMLCPGHRLQHHPWVTTPVNCSFSAVDNTLFTLLNLRRFD